MAYVGGDLGATGMELGLFERDDPRNPGLIKAVSIPTTRSFDPDIGAVQRTLAEFAEIAPIQGAGFDVAGRFNTARSQLLFAGNLKGWTRRPLAHSIRMALPIGIPVEFGNDAEALALYDAMMNPALEGKDFFAWYVGSGIGTGRITWIKVAGRWVPISLPMEGQHMEHSALVEFPNPIQCGCGKFNCTERLGSGDGVAERFGVDHARKVPLWFYQTHVAQAHARGMSWVLMDHMVDYVVFAGTVAVKEPYLGDCVRARLAELMPEGTAPQFVEGACKKADSAVAGLTMLNRGR